ncbi:DsbA family protein [Methylobacter sp. YRD-M1]|uniref:DsbA family protein n=1 Tax=Methylobacter sp. YRD-M1 TaxID=2911520 RepID=UPI00227D0F22|nr:DsbA family protein [Methylobacter sp. YRD-M1]WAK00424.1 DsbA family protein [Methylobacter sp. YRD-M1]
MGTRLYYIHDPLCSWCYAFKTSLSALKQALPPGIEFKRLLGGLAPDSTEPMPLALQQSIQQAWHLIEQTVPGVKFNFAFWSNNTPIRSTYPACRSLLAARKQGIEFEDRLLACIQEAYYQQTQNPALDSTLFECSSQAGLDRKQFELDYRSHEIDRQLQQEIKMARSFGVCSYPSLILVQNDRISPVAVNYRNYGTMLDDIERLLIDR